MIPVTEYDLAFLFSEAAHPDRNVSPAEIAASIHEDLIRSVMEAPAGPLRVRVRGAGTGLPWRPVNGLPKDGAV